MLDELNAARRAYGQPGLGVGLLYAVAGLVALCAPLAILKGLTG